MREIGTIKATPRTDLGKRRTRKIREEGAIPAIIYGRAEAPVAVTLSEHDVEVALDHGARTLTLDLSGTEQELLIKEVQYDHLDHFPIHLDLLRFDAKQRMTVSVGIELRGVPKGVGVGGILEQHAAEIEVECLVTDIPDTLNPLVSEMGIGDTLFARDLVLPEGVTLVSDPDDRIATVRELAHVAEPEAAPEGEAEAAQPEVIGRGKKEEEETEG